MNPVSIITLVFVCTVSMLCSAHADEDLEKWKAKHPRASYRGYSETEINLMASEVRKSRPQMSRGGWEWD